MANADRPPGSGRITSWPESHLCKTPMPRPESRLALDEIRAAHGRVTNMKRTLARSPVALHCAHDLV